MSKLNDQKIIDCLTNDQTLEMTNDELLTMLNAELEKPEEEIDAQLVAEILDALNDGAPEVDPEVERAQWLRIKAHFTGRQAKKPFYRCLPHIAAALVVVSVLVFYGSTDATASRWTFIQKIIKPIAETFGVIMDEQSGKEPFVSPSASDYSVSEGQSTRVAYASLDEVPERFEGYAIRPSWVPEGFVFVNGSYFSSVSADIFSMDFASGEDWLSLSIHVFPPEGTVSSYEFEQTVESPAEQQIGRYVVTFYVNADESVQSASWVNENAHYALTGKISEADVGRFVEQME